MAMLPVHNHALWQRGCFTNAGMKDRRFGHEGACGHFTVHSTLGQHRSKHQPPNAGSLKIWKGSLQYRLNVAQEENLNRSERVTLLDPDIILDDDRIAIII
jgi:hypothetical protein